MSIINGPLVHSSGATGSTGATTAAIDTTGANLLVIFVSHVLSEGTVSDNKGNIWKVAGEYGYSANQHAALFYCLNPVVGIGHTFSFSANGTYPCIFVAAFGGVSNKMPFDFSTGVDSTGSTSSVATGSMIPDQDFSLIITGISNNKSTFSIDSGFTITDQIAANAGVNVGGAMAWFIQGIGASVNPTWSWSGPGASGAIIAAFKPSTTYAAIKLLASASAGSTNGGTSVTTPAIDTTGANILVASISWNEAGTPALTDNYSNVWTALTGQAIGGNDIKIYYAKQPKTGTGHTFQVTGNCYPAICVGAFSGVDLSIPFDVQNGGTRASDYYVATGSVTPAAPAALYITALSINAHNFPAIDRGFVILGSLDYNAGQNIGCVMAYLTPQDGPTKSPTWTWATNWTNGAAAIAVFRQWCARASPLPSIYRASHVLSSYRERPRPRGR